MPIPGFGKSAFKRSQYYLQPLSVPLEGSVLKWLPFGITSAPEYFQKYISEILAGLDGTIFMMDDVLIYGKSQKEHDCRLTAVLERLQ